MKRQLYMGGGIMGLSKEGIGGGIIKGVDMGTRTGFFNPFKSAAKAVKKVTKGVKKIASSDLGKAALLYAGTAGLGALGAGAARTSTGFGGIFNPSNVLSNLGATGSNIFGSSLFTGRKNLNDYDPARNIFQKALGKITEGGITGNAGKFAALAGVTGFLTSTLGMSEEQAEEELAREPSKYLELYYRNLNPPTADTNSEEYEAQVRDFVSANRSEYAEGGRIGFDMGSPREGIGSLLETEDLLNEGNSGNEFFSMADAIGRQPNRGPGIVIEDEYNPKDFMIEKFQEESIAPKILGEGFQGGEKIFVIETPRGGTMMITEEDYITKFGKTNRAEGGRIGYAVGSDGPVLPEDPTKPVNPFAPKPTGPVLPDRMASNEISIDKIEILIKRGADNDLIKEFTGASDGVINQIRDDMERKNKAGGGIMNRMNYALGDTASQNAMQAASVEGLPVRQNPKGIKELDLRDNGGFIPPVGIKEKEDDIPAMLSNNEFVFTADAVRGMGDGNVNVGAQRMYDMMKKLEAGGSV